MGQAWTGDGFDCFFEGGVDEEDERKDAETLREELRVLRRAWAVIQTRHDPLECAIGSLDEENNVRECSCGLNALKKLAWAVVNTRLGGGQ